MSDKFLCYSEKASSINATQTHTMLQGAHFLARQTNIVSFDAARSARATRSGARDAYDTDFRRSGTSSRSSSRSANSRGESQMRSSARVDRKASRGIENRTASSNRSRTRSESGSRRGVAASNQNNASSRRRSTPPRESNVRTAANFWERPERRALSLGDARSSAHSNEFSTARDSSRNSTRLGSRNRLRFDDFDAREVPEFDEHEVGTRTRRSRGTAKSARAAQREKKSKQRLKARAEKLFNKQFGSRKGEEGAAEGAPRAAVYKGEMGKNQRRAARLVPAREFVGAATAKLNPFAWFSSFSVPASKLIAGTVVICVLAASITLYGPVQQYYQSVRENDRLQMQYAALENRSAALEAQHETLTSEAGIETIAHESYGWVKPGEETAWVEGLSSSAYNEKEVGASIAANVDVNRIGYPETWYSPFLDFVFDVH